MSLLTTLKEGGTLNIDTIGNLPINEDLDLITATPVTVSYLVIAGGGGGADAQSIYAAGGGGGAGGYRNSYASETSGDSSSTETPLELDLSTDYTCLLYTSPSPRD